MATTFTGLRVQDTYNAILKIGDNTNLTGTAKLLSDGLGNSSAIYLSTTSIGIGVTPSYQLHTSSNAKIGGNLIVSGNLTVNGTLTYLNVEDLAVEDPLIKLAKDNTANTLDIGFFGKYVATSTKYKGLFNDASDDKFKLFIGTGTEPTTTVDITASGYAVGTLVANLEGNVTGNVTGNVIGNVTGGTISGTTGTFSSTLDVDGDATFDANILHYEVATLVTKLYGETGSGYNASKLEFYRNTDLKIRLNGVDGSITAGGNLGVGGTGAFTGNLTGSTASFSGLVTGIAPTADLNFATKKYVDDNIPTITTPALSAVLSAGNTSGQNNLIIQDNDELIIGSSSDFKLYHNATNSLIRINTGNLVFNSFVDDGDITFNLDNGADPAVPTQYMRLDGGDENIVFSKPISGTTASFSGAISGNLIGNVDGNITGGTLSTFDDIDVYDTLAFHVSSTDAARQRADARDDDTNFSRLHWFGKSDTAGTSNFRHAYYDGAAYINVTAASNILTYTGGATFNDNLDVTKNSTGDLMSRIYNSNTSGTGTSVLRIANAGNQDNGARLEFSDSTYYNSSITADRTNGLRFFVHDDATSMALLLANNVLTLANDKTATFQGLISNYFSRTGNPNSTNTNLYLVDTTANAAEVGGSIVFSGKYTNAGAYLSGGPFIRAYKSNASDGDYSFGLKLGIRLNGSGGNDTALTISPNKHVTLNGGNLYLPEYIYHSGDEDTYLQFRPNRQTLVAGGVEFIDFANTTQDYITIGGGSDIDIKLVSSTNNKYIFIQGSDGKIGINDQTPSYAFDVNAETNFSTGVHFPGTRYNKGGSSTFWYAATTGARINMDARVDGTGVMIHKWNRNADDSDYLSYAENWYDGNSYHKISAYNNGFMLNGNIRFESYGAGNITGTLSRLVGFEANGGLIDVPTTTFLTGSGSVGRFPYYNTANTLDNSTLFYESANKIRHLQTIGPNDNVRDGFCVEDLTAMAANVGGQLTFRYMYASNGAITEGAMIRTYKLNANDGDYSSGLKFQVRNTGYDLSTKMTLNPSGFLGLATTTPQKPLHIEGATGSQVLITGASDTIGDTAGILLRAEDGEPNSDLRAKGGIFFERTALFGKGKLHLAVNGSANNDSATVANARLTIDDNGLVGIAKTSGMTSLLNFAANQNAADPGGDNWSGSAINTFGGDLATGRLFLQGYQQTGNDTIGFNIEGSSNRLVLYNYTDQRYLQIWDDSGSVTIPSGSLTVGGALTVAGNATFNGPSTKFNTDSDSFLEILDAGTNACYIRAGSSDEIYIGANNNYQLRLKTNKDVVMDNGGKFGIGVSSPEQDLHIKGDGDAAVLYLERINNNAGYLLLNGSINPQIAYPNAQDLRFATVSNSSFDNFSEKMRLNSSGNLLINQTSDLTTQKLQVNGFIDITNVDSSALRFYNGSTFRGGFGLSKWGTGVANSDMVCYAVNHLDIVTNGTSTANFRFRDDSSFTLNFGTHAFVPAYSGIGINVPSGTKKYLGFYDSGTTTYGGGMWYDEASNITSLYSLLAGTETQHVQLDRATGNTWINPSNGNVYIGDTTTPTASIPAPKFYVNGSSVTISAVGPNDSIRSGLAHYDSTAMGINNGGQIVLGYRYQGNSYTEGAIIRMYKTNATNGNYSSGLKFQVRNNGEDLSSKMTLTAGGDLSVVGSMTAAGDVIAFSDKRVKTNIKTIDNGLEKISKLRGVSYNRTDIDDKSNKIGVIAQEVKEVLPEVVNYDDEKDLFGVDYGKMSGVFIEAIKELKAEVDSLKQEIKELKK